MRSNHSREERQKIVEEYMQSGKPQTVFAPEHGIKPNTLSAWVTKYRTETAVQASDVHFVELKSTVISRNQNIIIRKSQMKMLHRLWKMMTFLTGNQKRKSQDGQTTSQRILQEGVLTWTLQSIYSTHFLSSVINTLYDLVYTDSTN